MEYQIKQEGKFKFIEIGEGEPLLLLHGLFGALSNFEHLIEFFKKTNKVIVPMLPLFDLDLLHTTVGGLPAMATDELVNECFEITNNRIKVIKIISLAKSAIRNNLGDELNQIKQPTCLIWGNNDTITPPFVGKEFNKLIPNSELHFIDKCGHAPMMEVPDEFNKILSAFISKLKVEAATVH